MPQDLSFHLSWLRSSVGAAMVQISHCHSSPFHLIWQNSPAIFLVEDDEDDGTCRSCFRLRDILGAVATPPVP